MTDSPRPYIHIMPRSDLAYDLTAFLKPSSSQRDTFTAHYYRCLPLVAANTLGWTLYNPFPFSVTWLGGDGVDRVVVETDHPDWVKSWFGYSTFTIDPAFVVETAPGIDLLIRSVPNHFKLPVLTLEGVVETDWLQASFTLNFSLRLPRISARYEVGEPLVQLVPYARQFIEDFDARIVTSGEAYDRRMDNLDRAAEKRAAWQAGRAEGTLKRNQFELDYMRGVDADGGVFGDHKKAFRVPPFTTDTESP